jgi:hypothetical protein
MGSAGKQHASGVSQMTTMTATRSELLARRSRKGIAQRGDVNAGIGAGNTRDDYRSLAFAEDFEQRFIGQSTGRRGTSR